MGDRSFDVDATSLEKLKPETILLLTETVLGFYCSGLYTIDKAHYEVGADIWSSIEGTEVIDQDIEIPMPRVLRRASRIAGPAGFRHVEPEFTERADIKQHRLLAGRERQHERRGASIEGVGAGLAVGQSFRRAAGFQRDPAGCAAAGVSRRRSRSSSASSRGQTAAERQRSHFASVRSAGAVAAGGQPDIGADGLRVDPAGLAGFLAQRVCGLRHWRLAVVHIRGLDQRLGVRVTTQTFQYDPSCGRAAFSSPK
jgi:hypothetical protein